jgi:hypothetical protein
VLTLEDREVRLRPVGGTLEPIRSLARPCRPKGGLTSEQLIMERRAEEERAERVC